MTVSDSLSDIESKIPAGSSKADVVFNEFELDDAHLSAASFEEKTDRFGNKVVYVRNAAVFKHLYTSSGDYVVPDLATNDWIVYRVNGHVEDKIQKFKIKFRGTILG